MTTVAQVHGRGLASARPASASIGTLYFSTDTSVLERWSGSAWETYTPASSASTEQIMDAVAAALVAGTGIGIVYDDPAGTITLTNSAPALTTEQLQDLVAAMLVNGTGVTATYDDVAGTVTIATTITQYTDEQVRDVIGAALVEGANIDLTVDDVANTITIAVTGVLADPTTTAGDLLVRNATVLQRLGVGANGEVLTVDTSLAHKLKWAAAAGGGSGEPSPLRPAISGRLHDFHTVYGGGAVAAAAISNGRLYGIPFAVLESTTFDRICAHLTNTTAVHYRLGVYTEGSNGLPDALLLDSGEFTSATATFQSAVISLTLAAGRYFLALLGDAAASFQSVQGTAGPRLLGTADATLVSSSDAFLYRTLAYAALPDPFGAVTAYLTSAPRVALRAA